LKNVLLSRLNFCIKGQQTLNRTLRLVGAASFDRLRTGLAANFMSHQDGAPTYFIASIFKENSKAEKINFNVN
jgi:hypothetical protein